MLETMFRELNEQHFGAALPLPKLLWNSRLRSSAGRFAPGSRNPLRPRAPEIEVASYLQELPDAEMHIRDTLLHEMVHYYLWFGQKPYGHTPEFHKILKRVGARRYNPVPKLSPVKYWYECKNCQKKVPAKRKIRRSACAACCKQWNKGYFSEKFLLVLSSGPAEPFLPAPKAQTPRERAMDPQSIIAKLESLKEMLIQRRQHK
jgi:predicted SprT family Zn-dependent metalloprotease